MLEADQNFCFGTQFSKFEISWCFFMINDRYSEVTLKIKVK